jgi:hypothetical protein
MKKITNPVYNTHVKKLNIIQHASVEAFKQKQMQGIYNMSPLTCLCGKHNDILIALTDRYGIEVTTVLCQNCGLLRIDPYYDDISLANFYRDDYRAIYQGYNNGDVEFISQHFSKRYTTGASIMNEFVQLWGGYMGSVSLKLAAIQAEFWRASNMQVRLLQVAILDKQALNMGAHKSWICILVILMLLHIYQNQMVLL